MPIRILAPEVASQIAAGEVVERPASVVKELVENALDAEPTSIEIQTVAAGRELIAVSDDGFGISSRELNMAAERHATSKLESHEDLKRISTLGFRGEALASMGSISKMIIISRTPDSESGASIKVEGGNSGTVRPIGSPVGTTVRVSDLFYNVPARLKFLKHERTEKSHINRLVTRYALAFPEVRFTLVHDNRLTLKTSGNGDRREVLAELYGVEIAKSLLKIDSHYDPLHIHGFTSPISITRSNRRELTFFVNNRPIQDTTLSGALIKAYHTLLMVNRYPISVLFIEIPLELVDVNVHPTKAEVRFQDPGRLFSSVRNAVRKALLAYGQAPDFEIKSQWSDFVQRRSASKLIDPSWSWSVDSTSGEPSIPAGEIESKPGVHGKQDSTQGAYSDAGVPLLRPVGQVASAYLVAEGPDGLYLIDQHAAHERILYEQFSPRANSTIPSQMLLQPVSVEFPAHQSQLIEDQLDLIKELGFQVEEFGRDSFLIRAIPSLLEKLEPAQALRIIVEDFEEDETPLESENQARLIARICKRGAIRAGQILSPEEQRTLISDLEACQSPRTCPHGRPTMIHLSVDLLERQFRRRGAH